MAVWFSSQNSLFLFLLLVGFLAPSMAALFSSLPKTLVVTASPAPGQVLHAGEDRITVGWSLNRSLPVGVDSGYEKIKVLLCYAPASQADRRWRKTYDNLKKDKTCQFKMTTEAYGGAAKYSYAYTVERSIPTATYFVRAYALDADGTQVGYGQTTDDGKRANLFEVVGISGRHPSLDVAAGCFSAFSAVALVFFFVVEKRKQK
ncbi:high-affinity nitrate transporter-activating protein 2.1-like [Curcuma longa]|uniref:high-affinity nitrate transporter-activating protein 2.1-like n=1 Tax=Curcuma longa TaxID=136217 RepID=UPI003D9F3628